MINRKNSTKIFYLAIFSVLLLAQFSIVFASQIVGYCRLSSTAAQEALPTTDPSRYSPINFNNSDGGDWTLDSLFPNGVGLTTETEVVVMTSGSYSGGTTYQYNGTNWFNTASPAVNAGSDSISQGSNLLISHPDTSTITPIVAGVYEAGTPSLSIALDYYSNLAVLTVAELNQDSAALSWTADPGTTNYTIYRGTSSDFASAQAIHVTSSLSYTDENLTTGEYYYFVTANSDGSLIASSTAAINVGDTSDFNSDGVDDLIFQHGPTGGIAIWSMDDSSLGQVSRRAGFSDIPNSRWQIVNHGDFNEDLSPDFVVRDISNGAIAILTVENNGIQSSVPLNANFPTGWRVAGVDDLVSLGEFNNPSGNTQNNTDLVMQHRNAGLISYWGIGDITNGTLSFVGGGFFPQQIVSSNKPSTRRWRLRGMADFNDDGNSDLFWQHFDTGVMAIWFLDAQKNLVSGGPLSIQHNNRLWEVSGFGDWNGDNKTDICIQHVNGPTIMWALDGLNVIDTSGTSSQISNSLDWKVRNSRQGSIQ